MRAVQEGQATIDATFTTMMDECLACRACETACPSGVPFGRMIEAARAQIEPTRPITTRGLRALGLRHVLRRPWMMFTAGYALALAQEHGPFGVIVDCVGGYSGGGCRALLVSGGRHIIVSGDGVGAQLQVLVPPFSSKTVLGRSTTVRLRALVDGIAAGKIHVAIAARMPLAEAEAALTQSQTGRVNGKIVLLT